MNRELSDEINEYLELLVQRKVEQGMSEQDARRAAMVELEGVEQVKENVRAGQTGFGVETFLQDFRGAVRTLQKKPGFTVTAVVALALGIGANTAIFSVINGVLLRSLAYRDPAAVVMLWEQNLSVRRSQNVVSPANFLDWQRQAKSFQGMATAWDTRANLTEGGEPTEIPVQRVTASFFQVLGVQPMIGRPFAEDEDRLGGNPVIILSHRLWVSRFGADSEVVGRHTRISGRDATIVGVMPPGFYFLNDDVQAWQPLALDPAMDYRKSGRFLRTIGRLNRGVSLEQAQSELAGIAKQLEQTFPDYNTGWGVSVVPIHEQVVGDIRSILLVLLAAVAFVLLIACANVANLLLTRATTRHKEWALRAALGASRMRLVRLMLTESVLLALLGGALGVLLAYGGIRLLVALGPTNIPRLHEIEIEWRVLGFTFAISLITGVLFGLLPALQASRPDLNDALKEASRGSSGGRSRFFRNIFVVAEVSLALILLVGAGLMFRSFVQLLRVRTGFASENVLTMRVQLPMAKYKETYQRASFFKQAQDRIAALPGVKTVGAINFLPLTGLASSSSFKIEGRPELGPGELPGTEVRVVTPNFFAAMGIPILKGRALNEHDGPESRVLLINETMAKRFFPNEDPVGKRIVVSWDPNVPDEIVGVVGDVKESALQAETNPAIYWPHAREPYQFMNFVVRTAADPMLLAAAAQKEIRALDPEQPVADVRMLSDVVSKSISRPRFNALLLGIFAGVALLLASVGLYGVMNYSTAQRTHEIGIRMALGATRADIMRLVVGNGMLLTLSGIAIGVIVSWQLTRVMQNLLFGITATDLGTFAGVSLLLLAVAWVANYLPARKATRVNPVIALHYE